MILRDYNCLAHGIFEGSEAICPHGCKGSGFVSIVHLKAPAIGSQRTKNLDAITRNLANQFGLTDMDNRGGQAVKRPDPMAAKRAEEYNEFIQQKFGSPWQAVAPGGVMQPDKTIKGGSEGSGAIQSIAGFGAQSGSAMAWDKTGNVTVPFNDGETAVPLSREIKPDAIAAEHKAEI
jgi:hypothetical protein